MNKIQIEAYGKVNISLDVIGKRKDNYHEIETIMQQIDLKDILTIRDRKNEIKIECNNSLVPLDSSNIVHKAFRVLSEKCHVKRGAHIIIEKNIPVAAGLAGGSANAAATLKGLNKLWNLNLTEAELMDIGVHIGADVPFCIMGGTALAKGIGEKLEKLDSFKDHMLLLANPGIEVTSSHVYSVFDVENIKNRPQTDTLLKAIQKNDIYTVSKNMVNVLEQVTCKEYKEIEKIKEDMIKCGALGSLMSGSGPTVFGFFDDEDKLYNCKRILEKRIEKVFIARTI